MDQWLERFRQRWDQAERESEVKGAVRKHCLRVELIARLSTIPHGKHGSPPHSIILGECILAAKLVCKKKEAMPDPDAIPEEPT